MTREMWKQGASVHHCLGVLGDLVIQVGGALVPVDLHRVLGTDGDAAAAAHAFVVVDVRLPFSMMGAP